LKGTKARPAKSCLDILVSSHSKGTGVYWLDPPNTGTPIQGFCDMDTDGGNNYAEGIETLYNIARYIMITIHPIFTKNMKTFPDGDHEIETAVFPIVLKAYVIYSNTMFQVVGR